MKRFIVAALVLPVFLVGCGAPASEYEDTTSDYEAPPEPEIVEEEVFPDQIVMEVGWDNVRIVRERVHGVDCIITTNNESVSTTCDWSSAE